MPRLLTTSASACRKLLTKAELMGIDVAALEFQEAQIASLNDVRKKWHIPPAFSVEFIGYYLDRISRSKDVQKNLQEQIELNKTLVSEQQSLREKYDECIAIRAEHVAKKTELTEKIEKLHTIISALCPNKTLTSIDNIIAQHDSVEKTTPNPTPLLVPRPMSVPTAAALKMGVGFPLTIPGTNDDTNRILSTQCQNKPEIVYECGICKRVNDQHLLAKCDTCHLHYHLGCLTPPLTRHPKKSKIYGWQCSECDEDNPDGIVQLTSGPRKSRTKYSKDGTIVPVDSSRDVSMDESGADADDDKINVQLTKNSSFQTKSPQLSPTKIVSKKNDKVEKSPLKKNKMQNAVDRENSMAESTLSMSDDANSPSKYKQSLSESSTNLDKVIEAVSKGILDGSIESIDETSHNHTHTKPVKVNGDQSEMIDSKSTVRLMNSPSPSKIKAIKKSKKEKERDKGKEKDKDKDKIKFKEKIKRKENLKTTVETVTSQCQLEVKRDKLIIHENPQMEEYKAENNICENSFENTKMEVSVDSTEPSKDIQTFSTYEDSSKVHNSVMNGKIFGKFEDASISTITNVESDADRKQSRKRRKEKHRNKHGLDSDRSLSKEHKKKRKRKSHDHVHPDLESFPIADGVPKIKIKFKALPLPGETAAESHFFYVPANMVRPRDFRRTRPASVNSIDDVTATPFTSKSPPSTLSSPTSTPHTPQKELNQTIPASSPSVRTRRSSVILSPSKANSRHKSTPITITPSLNSNDINEIQVCYVCQVTGKAQDLVKCDECKRCYHFGCLDPPLKKTPKRRGYSWHCAECDPTDKEDN